MHQYRFQIVFSFIFLMHILFFQIYSSIQYIHINRLLLLSITPNNWSGNWNVIISYQSIWMSNICLKQIRNSPKSHINMQTHIYLRNTFHYASSILFIFLHTQHDKWIVMDWKYLFDVGGSISISIVMLSFPLHPIKIL